MEVAATQSLKSLLWRGGHESHTVACGGPVADTGNTPACARGAAEDGGAHLPREAHCAADAGLGGEGDGDLLDGRVHGTAPVVLAGPLMLQSHLGVVELELEAALVRVVQVPAGEGDMMYRVT